MPFAGRHADHYLVEGMTVKDLADKLEVREDVLKKFDKRLMMNINTTLDTPERDDARPRVRRGRSGEIFEEEMLEVEAEDINADDVVTRAPVVTVMGRRPR